MEGLTAAGAGKLTLAELDMHINEPAFAEAVSTELRSLMEIAASENDILDAADNSHAENW